MTWLYVILGTIAGLALLSYLISCFMYKKLFFRPERSKDVPEWYKDTPHYKVSRAGMKVMDSLPVEDCYMTSRDGLKLHSYLYPAEGGAKKKFVICVHGYRSYARPEGGPYIDFYREKGYSMLLPDDRAHAPSEGKWIGFGVLDRLDVTDWAKYIVERFGDDTEILLHGISMGSATVIAASGEEDLPKQVKGITADCGYTSAWDILSYQLKQMHVPAWPLLNICERISIHRAGYSFHEHTPLEQVKNAKVPMFFAQGGKDKMVPPYMAKELYEACPTEKRLLLSEDAGHGETIAFMPDEYHKNMIELFNM